MSSYCVASLIEPVSIGSLESDMEFARNWNGQETDVIRFRPNRRPSSPSLDHEWLVMDSALAAELRDKTNKSNEARQSAGCIRHAERAYLPVGLSNRCSDNVSDDAPVETEIVA
jgi:hypothetical protein